MGRCFFLVIDLVTKQPEQERKVGPRGLVALKRCEV